MHLALRSGLLLCSPWSSIAGSMAQQPGSRSVLLQPLCPGVQRDSCMMSARISVMHIKRVESAKTAQTEDQRTTPTFLGGIYVDVATLCRNRLYCWSGGFVNLSNNLFSISASCSTYTKHPTCRYAETRGPLGDVLCRRNTGTQAVYNAS